MALAGNTEVLDSGRFDVRYDDSGDAGLLNQGSRVRSKSAPTILRWQDAMRS